jgi:LysR family transcriptional regulator, transcriptional activator of nhaA
MAGTSLLPAESVILRRSLHLWFDKHGIVRRVVAEFEDSPLLKVFGADGVVERFYAISAERRLGHPAVLAIARAAQQDMLAAGRGARDSA